MDLNQSIDCSTDSDDFEGEIDITLWKILQLDSHELRHLNLRILSMQLDSLDIQALTKFWNSELGVPRKWKWKTHVSKTFLFPPRAANKNS